MSSNIFSLKLILGKAAKSSVALTLLLLLLGSGLGVVAAYLVVSGDWQIALILIACIPGLVLLHKYPFFAIIVWLVLTPFLLHTNTEAQRGVYWIIHRGVPPLTIGIILVSSALHIQRRNLPRLSLAELAMAGYMGVSLLSIYFQNEDPRATTYLFYDRVIIPMCLYLIIRLSIANEKQMMWLIPVALFTSLSQSIIGVLSWFAPRMLPVDWLSGEAGRTVGSLVNTSVYTVTLVFFGLLILHDALNLRAGSFRLLLIFSFLLSAYSVFISFSRASWLAGILISLGLVYLYPKFMLKISLIVLPLLVGLLGLIFTSQIQWARERLYSAEAERSALSRLPVMYAAYRMFEAKPFFGWGYGNFDLYDRPFQGRVAELSNDNKDHASHNLYLTVIAEQGLIGLALFIGPVVWLLVKSVRRLPQLPESGFWNRKLLIILWLVIISHIVVNNFANMRVVFGLGMWWITLGFIANLVYDPQWSAGRITINPKAKALLKDHLPSILQ